jgi:hypothetical protein
MACWRSSKQRTAGAAYQENLHDVLSRVPQQASPPPARLELRQKLELELFFWIPGTVMGPFRYIKTSCCIPYSGSLVSLALRGDISRPNGNISLALNRRDSLSKPCTRVQTQSASFIQSHTTLRHEGRHPVSPMSPSIHTPRPVAPIHICPSMDIKRLSLSHLVSECLLYIFRKITTLDDSQMLLQPMRPLAAPRKPHSMQIHLRTRSFVFNAEMTEPKQRFPFLQSCPTCESMRSKRRIVKTSM